MRRIFLMALVCLVCSCSPQAYSMLVESRDRTSGGLDISGKTVSILYLTQDNVRDSTFAVFFADGLAQGLEAEFFKGAESIEVFSTPRDSKGYYADRDSLVNLMIQTGTDVMFLVDTPEDHKIDIYAYDSMNKEDKVMTFVKEVGSAYDRQDESLFCSDAQYLGYEFSKTFYHKWIQQLFTLVYFDNMDGTWTDAIMYAEDFKWSEAIDLWLAKIDSGSAIQSSCAAYDVAVGCYMLGQYDLALKWLDFSDSKYPVSLSAGLRKRIVEHM